jgi:glutaredoxin
MHDLLLQHQQELRIADLVRYATMLGLDLNRFRADLRSHAHATRVAQDVESADLSGVSGTPTFFINGQRHYGAFDLETLTAAIRTERDQLTTVRSSVAAEQCRAAPSQPGRVKSSGRTSRPTRSISRGPAGRRASGGRYWTNA